MDRSLSLRQRLPAPGSRGDHALRLALTAAVVFMPLLAAYVLTAAQGLDMFHALPLWNDESWWYLQYSAMSEYGRPLGYFGYVGTHAQVGTYANWGMFAVLPIGLLARLFGWGLHAFVYYNFFYLALANLIFILLARPSKRNLLMLAATNVLLYINICYAVTAMNEAVRYSVGIMAAGIIYRILTVPETTRVRQALRVTVVPLFLLFATCFDLLLGIFVPVYLYLMLRRRKLVWRLTAAAAGSGAALYLQHLAESLTGAPWVTLEQTVSFAPTTLRMAITQEFFTILGRMQKLDPLTILGRLISGEAMPIYLWFCLLLYITMGILLWRTIVGKGRERALNGLCLFILAGCWGGLAAMYGGATDWSFIRHCNAGVCCVMMLAAMAPRGQRHGWYAMVIVCLLGATTCLSVFTATFSTSSRFSSDYQDEALLAEREVLSEVIVLDEDAADPWANTVTPYHMTPDQYCCLPFGVGVNSCVYDPATQQSRYAVLGRNYGDLAARADDVQALTEGGYAVIYEDEGFVVLENRRCSYD